MTFILVFAISYFVVILNMLVSPWIFARPTCKRLDPHFKARANDHEGDFFFASHGRYFFYCGLVTHPWAYPRIPDAREFDFRGTLGRTLYWQARLIGWGMVLLLCQMLLYGIHALLVWMGLVTPIF